ncbi:MAG TPA: alpha-mannosidase, partial [Trueperaceae bacterium]
MRFFPLEKLSARIAELRTLLARERVPIPSFRYLEGDPPGANEPGFDDSSWQQFPVGSTWGGYDKVAWFRASVAVPSAWARGKVVVRLLVGPRDGGDSTAEALLHANGRALQGIDIWHPEAWLPPDTFASGSVDLAIRAWSGVLGVPAVRTFRVAELLLVDEGAERLYFLADTVHQALLQLDPDGWQYRRLLTLLHDSMAALEGHPAGSEAYYAAAADAAGRLAAGLKSAGGTDPERPVVTAVGHAHIDLAWLWRQAHAREKAQRTFATVLHLMDQYPEYRFMHSSPQLYRWLEHDHPDLFERVRRRIRDGRWEITGGMWVEADTNLPSGESLIRQIVHGKRYMRERFGVDSKVLWLPDVFGYSAVLPQLLAKSGLPYFVTTKLSWNQFNRMPHDTFRWRGIDGTEVLAHFITTPERNSHHYTYNGELDAREVTGIWREYRQKDVNDELLLAYGWGDGGGGPTREMLEAARVMDDLPGVPRVRQGHVEPFFERLARRVEGESLPVWDGELYLEYHRGTYTSQAAIKRANRRNEGRLHDAELAGTLAALLFGAPYPDLREAWELLLYNQFHDVLPGSSIAPVYVDSAADHARIAQVADDAFAEAEALLPAPEDLGFLLFNSLGWARDGLVELPVGDRGTGLAAEGDDGQHLESQEVGGGGSRTVLLRVPEVPSLGYRWVRLRQAEGSDGHARDSAVSATERTLENEHYRLELDERGQLARVYDKTNRREVLPPGRPGNVLQLFEDKPLAFDAWDIDPYYQEAVREVAALEESAVEEDGPLRAVLRLRWSLEDSEVTQRIVLTAGSRRIEFRTQVNWQERRTLLKVAFPVLVRARHATYDIGLGAIERPTHWNTSWDWARFEVPAHRWADISEGGYGVALLNDCKYGYDVKDDVMRLTLLRSPVRPDPDADRGRHEFVYALLPHAGDWRAGDVVRHALDLNA